MIVHKDFLRAKKSINGELPDINAYKLFLVILEAHYGCCHEIAIDKLKELDEQFGTKFCKKTTKLIDELSILTVNDIVALDNITFLDNCIKFRFSDDFDKAFPGSFF